MLNKDEVRMIAAIAIADLFGREYFKTHITGSCEAFTMDNEETEPIYFLGFEGDEGKGLWTVFAKVSINRENGNVVFLDYKTPNGKRMEHPISPISFA